jgi:two-component system chemotaxis sensor kinase CheA
MKIILPVILLTGILLTMIFALLFTSKFRRQISLLTTAANITGKGNFDYRVPIISKDEIGELGITFNKMISEISNKGKIEKEYAEFITIINQNITLKNLSNAVLHKILEATKLKFGSIYLSEENSLRTIASIGLGDEATENIEKKQIYKNVIDNKEIIEMTFDKNFPVVRSSLIEIQIRYILIVPVVSGNELIGIIELASETIPPNSPGEILNRFIHQFAIGLRNAVSYEKLSNLVDELKQLNEDYQVQNIQIKGKNEELVRLHKELQAKAEELEEERRKAVELTYVKSQFLASMSHELKTPLNSIIGLSELTEKDSSAQQKTKDRVRIVLRNSKKLLSMINNILEFSKIESGKYELSEQNFLLSELLADIYTSSEILSGEKQLPLSVKLNYNKNLLIKTDRSKLEHILLNLVSNAIKFTDAGTVSLTTEKINATDLIFKVTDTGIGISEENQKIIFDEFKQLQSGNNRKYSGAGLGLALCNRYADLLKGKLAVKSEESLGTTFSLLLPHVIVDEVEFILKDQFEMTSHRFGGSHFVKLDRGNESGNDSEVNLGEFPKILIVDDDKDTLYTVGEVLHGLGFELYYATNGIECLKQLENLKPDLILLDIMMPEMDGFETINKIRSNSLWKNFLVYALTAHAMLDDKYIIEGSGFDDLITKPLDSTSLQIKVKQAIINNQKNKL